MIFAAIAAALAGASLLALLSPVVGMDQPFVPPRHGSAGMLLRERIGLLDRLHRRLAFMQIGLGVPQYLWLCLLFGGVTVLLSRQVLGSWWLALPTGVVGLTACERLVRWLWRRRRERFEQGNLRALRIMAGSLRTSPSYLHAFEQVASSRFVEPVVAREYKRVAELLRSNVPLETALREMQLRTGSTDLVHLSTIVQVQRELGGDMAKTLDYAAVSIMRRRQLQRRRRAHLSQVLSQVNVLSVMPFVFAVSLWVNNPRHFDPLLASMGGRLAIWGAFASILAGGELIRHLAVGDEQRGEGTWWW